MKLYLCSQEFLISLNEIQKDDLLVRLLSQGRGSLEYAKHMVLSNENPPEPEQPVPEWCVCGICRPMPLDIENVCCRKRTCVTSFQLFNNVCLDKEVLLIVIRARCDIRAYEPDYSPNSYRPESCI